jgi:chromosome segregation ATPase
MGRQTDGAGRTGGRRACRAVCGGCALGLRRAGRRPAVGLPAVGQHTSEISEIKMKLKRNLTKLKQPLTKFKRHLTKFKRHLTKLRRILTKLKRNLTKLKRHLTKLKRNLTKLKQNPTPETRILC